jgi:hypothetical protein
MRDLAALVPLGLDPLLLAREQPAEKYLVLEPRSPAADDLVITVTPVGRAPREASYRDFVDALQSAHVKQVVTPCWQEHWRATQDASLKARLELRHGLHLDVYDDFDRSTLTIDEAPAGDAPHAAAVRCVRAALVPIADDFARTSPESTWRAGVLLMITSDVKR